MGKKRQPIKKNSIEKKKKIIEKGFELICNKGYHNTTCIDIAKYAGVSTGIIYQYFEDKRAIFLEGIKEYSNKIMFPMNQILETKSINKKDLDKLISQMTDKFIKNHTMSKKAHKELSAISCLDEEVANLFYEREMLTTKKIEKILENNNILITNSKEKIHILLGLIDDFCHEVVYHKHDDLDYDAMKKEVEKVALSLLNN